MIFRRAEIGRRSTEKNAPSVIKHSQVGCAGCALGRRSRAACPLNGLQDRFGDLAQFLFVHVSAKKSGIADAIEQFIELARIEIKLVNSRFQCRQTANKNEKILRNMWSTSLQKLLKQFSLSVAIIVGSWRLCRQQMEYSTNHICSVSTSLPG